MVRAERELLDVLGIERLLAVGGGSLGGMQALEWTVRLSRTTCAACIPIATHRAPGQPGRGLERDRAQRDHGRPGLAGRRLLRHRARADGGHRRGAHGRPRDLPLGRVDAPRSSAAGCRIATTTRYSLTEPDFAVESYLRHQAETFAGRFDANSYLYISRALTYFDLARDHGGGSLERAVADVAARYLLVSFSSDWLYPPRDSRRAGDGAARPTASDVEHHRIQASYGHDSFLLEEARQAPLDRRVSWRTMLARHG